jgi:hypothetical protein
MGRMHESNYPGNGLAGMSLGLGVLIYVRCTNDMYAARQYLYGCVCLIKWVAS